MKKTILLFLLSGSLFAQSKLVVDEIWGNIHEDFKYETITKVETEVETSSVGKNRVEEMLRKNREKIAGMQNVGGAASGKEIVERLLKKRRAALKDRATQAESDDDSKQDIISKRRKGQEKWYGDKRAEYEQTIKRWKEAEQKFYRKLKIYKENLVQFEVKQPVPKKLITKNVTKTVVKDYKIVSGAELPVRDQGARPTCSAFAGVRAVEILASQQNRKSDLSEQYMYWSSKPNCRTRECSKKGSWITRGYDYSKKAPNPDIPTENSCPYSSRSLIGNETQIPLSLGCNAGKVKITSYKNIMDLDGIIDAIDRDKPVVGGFLLSPNFYKNNGYIFFKDSKKNGSTDSHAKGHALLVVGYMKLPKAVWAEEGKVCFMVANSWGEGWGKGGFACLSERWVQRYRSRNPFVSLEGIQI